MAYRWPAGTVFTRISLDVEERSCPICDRAMYGCDHRYHDLWTLAGPTQVVNRLVRCPEPHVRQSGTDLQPRGRMVDQHAPLVYRLGCVVLAWASPLCPSLVGASTTGGITGHLSYPVVRRCSRVLSRPLPNHAGGSAAGSSAVGG